MITEHRNTVSDFSNSLGDHCRIGSSSESDQPGDHGVLPLTTDNMKKFERYLKDTDKVDRRARIAMTLGIEAPNEEELRKEAAIEEEKNREIFAQADKNMEAKKLEMKGR